MAHYAIGDLQGCHAEFMALLERLRFDAARDRLWLTGDLVNRGPASLEVLREVRALGNCVTVVLGNHDLHLLAMAWAPATVRRREPELVAVLDAPDAADLLSWLASRPLLHRDAALGWTLIHAGLPPQWTLAVAEACAREVEAALACRSRRAARRDVRRSARPLVAGPRGPRSPAVHGQLPDATAIRGCRRAPAARTQGTGRHCAGGRHALVPAPGEGDRPTTRSSSATGRRSDTCRSRACAASTPVACGAARCARCGSIARRSR